MCVGCGTWSVCGSGQLMVPMMRVCGVYLPSVSWMYVAMRTALAARPLVEVSR